MANSFATISDGSNGLFSRNALSRNSNGSMGSYILGPASYSTGIVSITDNAFDFPTFNGTDQNLVKNLPLQWIYKNNLNTPATANVRRITTFGTYNVALEDDIIELNLTGAIVVNLPNIALSPPGRRITIKDANGTCDTNPITIRATTSLTDAIENLYTDYVFTIPYGSVTLVCSIDPNGGGQGSGLTPKFMWSVV
jgi:hypothetical protein